MTQMRIATRRAFLAQGLGLVGVGAAVPDFLVRTALAGPAASPGQNVLVVLQLSGGHDGLSAALFLTFNRRARRDRRRALQWPRST